ncbi:hypothetical protein BH11PSE11_BH11PSE11_21960 [soil metagenome]
MPSKECTPSGRPFAKRPTAQVLPLRRLKSPAMWLSGLIALTMLACLPPAKAAATPGASANSLHLPNIDLTRQLAAIPASKISSESRARAMQGLNLIGQNRLEEGSAQMNAALQLDPGNSYLQFFNAFTYHLMARAGDTQKLELAEQGYALAVQFDGSNWIAHYFLGLLHFEQRNFRAAQRELAEVLLFRGDDQEVLTRLIAASYYSGDPVTAAACLDRLRILKPTDSEVLRLSAIVNAALGRNEEAQRWLAQYEALAPDARELTRARERVAHWATVHRNGKAVPAVSQQDKGGERNPAFINTQLAATAKPASTTSQGQSGKRMVLVDVVIMRTEDSIGSHKGVNLLNALNLQFGNGASPGFSKTYSSVRANGALSSTTSLTRAINIPALTYSLNIANANSNWNEVLARPTLVALEGVRSEFFSGSTLSAAVVATGVNAGNAVQIEKEVGVRLSITPSFVGGNKVLLAVDAQRTFFKPVNKDVEFPYKVELSKVMVDANVVMEFGETLVLGGLSEKETTRARDGVPILQDIPGVQYLFSSKDSGDVQRSVLMLITPREPQYTYRTDEAVAADGGDAESLKELRARYGDWFKPYPNLASVFSQLNVSSIYREFRTGDVTLEKWDKQESTRERLQQALDFLFF